MAENYKFTLGQIVKDTYTGFTGRITCRCQYLTGCNRYTVQPEGLTKEGKLKEVDHFDEDQLAAVEPKANRLLRKKGGPQAPPPGKHPLGG